MVLTPAAKVPLSFTLSFTKVPLPLPTAVQYVFCHIGGKHAFMDVSLLNKKHVRKTPCQPSSVPATGKTL